SERRRDVAVSSHPHTHTHTHTHKVAAEKNAFEGRVCHRHHLWKVLSPWFLVLISWTLHRPPETPNYSLALFSPSPSPLSLFPSVCLSVCLPACLSLCLSAC